MIRISTRIESINSRQELSDFLMDVAENVRSGSLQWENSNPATYLEAVSAWISDMDGYLQNRGEGVPESPSWRLIAEIIIAGSMYE